jgi:hypothetical protein
VRCAEAARYADHPSIAVPYDTNPALHGLRIARNAPMISSVIDSIYWLEFVDLASGQEAGSGSPRDHHRMP